MAKAMNRIAKRRTTANKPARATMLRETASSEIMLRDDATLLRDVSDMAPEDALASTLTSLALARLQAILLDKTAPHGVAKEAALGVLDRAGYSARRFDRPDRDRDLVQRSTADLQAEIDKLQDAIARKAVDVTPNSEPIDEQTLDLYE